MLNTPASLNYFGVQCWHPRLLHAKITSVLGKSKEQPAQLFKKWRNRQRHRICEPGTFPLVDFNFYIVWAKSNPEKLSCKFAASLSRHFLSAGNSLNKEVTGENCGRIYFLRYVNVMDISVQPALNLRGALQWWLDCGSSWAWISDAVQISEKQLYQMEKELKSYESMINVMQEEVNACRWKMLSAISHWTTPILQFHPVPASYFTDTFKYMKPVQENGTSVHRHHIESTR